MVILSGVPPAPPLRPWKPTLNAMTSAKMRIVPWRSVAASRASRKRGFWRIYSFVMSMEVRTGRPNRIFSIYQAFTPEPLTVYGRGNYIPELLD